MAHATHALSPPHRATGGSGSVPSTEYTSSIKLRARRLAPSAPCQRPHSFQVRSIAEVAKYLPSSEASAHMTRPSCPSMVLMSEWSRIDHSLTLLSYEAVIR